MTKVKISVVKKLSAQELYGDAPPVAYNQDTVTAECDQFELGQEFVLDTINCPPGFCGWAFADIQRDLVHVFFRGSYPWLKEKGVAVSCCTDGLRPVVFRLERIEEPAVPEP